MGAVYEAVRTDGYQQRAAIKVIKQELDTGYAQERFANLKPANIPVTENGEPKLLDFEIAKLLDPDA